MKTLLTILLVTFPAVVFFIFLSRLRRRWDEDRYREEMIFEEELHKRKKHEEKI